MFYFTDMAHLSIRDTTAATSRDWSFPRPFTNGSKVLFSHISHERSMIPVWFLMVLVSQLVIRNI